MFSEADDLPELDGPQYFLTEEERDKRISERIVAAEEIKRKILNGELGRK